MMAVATSAARLQPHESSSETMPPSAWALPSRLQPHESSSETRRGARRSPAAVGFNLTRVRLKPGPSPASRARSRRFNLTRVRLKQCDDRVMDYKAYWLQPHESSSETGSCTTASPMMTRLQPHESSSETRLRASIDFETERASTSREFV